MTATILPWAIVLTKVELWSVYLLPNYTGILPTPNTPLSSLPVGISKPLVQFYILGHIPLVQFYILGHIPLV